jgi:hypothetical protein
MRERLAAEASFHVMEDRPRTEEFELKPLKDRYAFFEKLIRADDLRVLGEDDSAAPEGQHLVPVGAVRVVELLLVGVLEVRHELGAQVLGGHHRRLELPAVGSWRLVSEGVLPRTWFLGASRASLGEKMASAFYSGSCSRRNVRI